MKNFSVSIYRDNLLLCSENDVFLSDAAKTKLKDLFSKKINKVLTDEEKKLIIKYDDEESLIIRDYKEVLENEKYKDLFTPIYAVYHNMPEEAVQNLEGRRSRKRIKKIAHDKINKFASLGLGALVFMASAKYGLTNAFSIDQTEADLLTNPPEIEQVEDEIEGSIKYDPSVTLEYDEEGNEYYDLYGDFDEFQEVESFPIIEAEQVLETEQEEIKEEKPLSMVELVSDKISNHGNAIYTTTVENITDDKYINVVEKYYDLIKENCEAYGVDPALLIAIASQERGYHDTEIDPGGAVGLFQIQYDVWVNKNITAFNHKTGDYKTLHIDDENIRTVETGCEIAAMHTANCLNHKNYNNNMALQSYNSGEGAVAGMVAYYSEETGRSVEEIMADQSDDGWKKYASLYAGDLDYVDHVMQYIPDDVTELVHLTPDGQEIKIPIVRISKTKTL